MDGIRRYNIAYVSTYDVRDIENWSGIPFFMGRLLEKYIGNVTYIDGLMHYRSLGDEIKHFYYKLFLHQKYFKERTKACGQHYGRQINDRLKHGDFDLIFTPSTVPIAYLETEIPIVVWTDATFSSMVNYYFTDLCEETIRDGNRMERLSLGKCRLVVFSSEWAARSAVMDYCIPESKIEIIQFGANLVDIPEKRNIKEQLSNPLEILFVGKEWERKGGDEVYQTFIQLNRCGIATHLTIVGSVPSKKYDLSNITVFPYLNKNDNSDLRVMYQLYRNADFLLLPSLKECAGIVFAEASAFGLPILTSDTGGIPSMVKDGFNGFLLPSTATGQEYSEKIKSIIADKTYYGRLCRTARQYYDEVINWDTAGVRLRDAVHRRIK